MDVAPDSDLYDFVASLDGEHNEDNKDVQVITQPADEAAVAVDVWRLIADAVDDWSQRIFDAECLHKRSESFTTSLEGSIYRLQLDGFYRHLSFPLNMLLRISL